MRGIGKERVYFEYLEHCELGGEEDSDIEGDSPKRDVFQEEKNDEVLS